MKTNKIPDQQYLIECFHYNENDGILTWKIRPRYHFINDRIHLWWNKMFSNKLAGRISSTSGYYHVSIDYVRYQSHRVIWKYMTGNDPINVIDHINRNRIDNRFCNLRDVDLSKNSKNSKIRITNKSGYTGVNYIHGKYVARLTVDGKRIFLGYFSTPELANESIFGYKSINNIE